MNPAPVGRMVWEKSIGDKQTRGIKGRMEERGLDLWGWYIGPSGALGRAFGGSSQWVDGVGARKVCTLPEAPLGNEKMTGELRLIGGEQALATIDGVPLDIGECMAQKAGLG